MSILGYSESEVARGDEDYELCKFHRIAQPLPEAM